MDNYLRTKPNTSNQEYNLKKHITNEHGEKVPILDIYDFDEMILEAAKFHHNNIVLWLIERYDQSNSITELSVYSARYCNTEMAIYALYNFREDINYVSPQNFKSKQSYLLI